MAQPPEPTRRDPASTLRENPPDPTRREQTLDPTQREAVPSDAATLLRLPADLARRYRVQRELPTQGAEADLLLIEPLGGGEPVVCKLYRRGLQPNIEVLRQISATNPDHVVRLLEHGSSEGRSFEIMEWIEQGSLRDLLQKGPLPQARVRQLLTQLQAALQALHAQGIRHRDLKPENLLIRSIDPLRLVLTDFGIASVAEATLHFTSAHRTLRYAAPEAAGGAVSPASDYWSLGMILAESITGRHPFAGLSDQAIQYQLNTQAIPLEGVDEPWRTLCRGLLVRDPKRRWGGAEITLWLAGDRTLQAPEEAVAPSESGAPRATRPYRLQKQECWTGVQLATRLAQHWADGIKDLQRGQLTPWLRDELHDQDAARLVMDLLEDRNLSPDGRLLRLLLHLDPRMPPVWKGRGLDNPGLMALAQQAMQNGVQERSLIAELWTQRVLEAVAQAGRPAHQELHTAWVAAVTDYEQGWARVIQAGATNELRPELPEALPALLLAVLDPAFAAGLLQKWREGQSGWEAASDCSWFLALAKKFKVKSPSHALIALRLGPEADRLARQPWKQLTEELHALEQQAIAKSLARPMLRELQSRLAQSFYETEEVKTLLNKVQDWNVEVKTRALSVIRTFTGHTKFVNSVAFSPDGRHALSGSADCTIKLWDARKGQEIHTFSGHTNSVNSVAFSPDGRYALSGSADCTLKLWDVTTGMEVRSFVGHSSYSYSRSHARYFESIAGKVNSISFSPDGKTALSGSDDNTIRFWDVCGGKELRSISVRGNRIISFALSPDGRNLLSSSIEVFIPPKSRQREVEDSGIKLWDVTRGQQLRTFSERFTWGKANSLTFSPDGRYALSGSTNNTLTLWEVATGHVVRTFTGHTADVNSVAFSPDGRYALSGSNDKTLKLWEVATGQELCTLASHVNSVNSVAFSSDGYHALSGSDDGTLKLWALWRIERTQRSYSLGDLISWEQENALAIAPLQALDRLTELQRDFAELIATNTFFADRVTALSKSLDSFDPETSFQCLQAISALRAAEKTFRDYDRLQTELKPLLSRSQGLRWELGILKTQLQNDPNQPAVREQMSLLREQAKAYAEAFGDYDRLQAELKPLLPRSEDLRREVATVESFLQDHETLPTARERMALLREQAKAYAEAFGDYDRLQVELKSLLLPRSEGLRREVAAIEPLLQKYESLLTARERMALLREQAKAYAEAFDDYDQLQAELKPLLPRSEDLRREVATVKSFLQDHETLPTARERMTLLREQAKAYAETFGEYERFQVELKPLLLRSEGLRREAAAVETLLQSPETLPTAWERMALLREQAIAYSAALGDFDRLQVELKPLLPGSESLRREVAAVEPLLQEYGSLPAAQERMAAIRDQIQRQEEVSRAIADMKNKYASFTTPGGDVARDCAELERWFQAERPPEAILVRIDQIRQQATKLVVAQREYERLRTEFAALFTHTTALATELGEVERRLSTRRYDDGFAAFGLILELRERAVPLRESLRDEHFAAAVTEETRQDQRWRWRRDYREAERRYRIAGELGHPQAAEHLAGLRKKMA